MGTQYHHFTVMGPGRPPGLGGRDGSMKIWDSIRDQESSVLPGHAARATSVAWSPDGKRLASGGDDGKIRIWDPAARKEVLTLEGTRSTRGRAQFGLIRSLAWSPDGRRLASAGLDGTAKVWEVDSGREVFALPADRGSVWSVAWSPDGTHLAAGSEDGTIRVVEGLERTPEGPRFPGTSGLGPLAGLEPEGGSAGVRGADKLLKVWDPIRGVELVRMHEDTRLVPWRWLEPGWQAAGIARATGSSSSGTRRRAGSSRPCAAITTGWRPSPGARTATRLASACIDDSVRVWDPSTGEEAFVLRGDPGEFHDVSWDPDGARLAAASSDGQIWIWDATRGFESDTTARALPYIERAVASGTARGEVRRWYAESFIRAGKAQQAVALLKDEPERVSTLRPVRQVAELMDVGVAAVQQGRLADAAVALRGAGERLQPLRSAWPGDPVLARLHGTSLGFLGSTLRGLKRPREALESHRASVAAYESLDAPERRTSTTWRVVTPWCRPWTIAPRPMTASDSRRGPWDASAGRSRPTRTGTGPSSPRTATSIRSAAAPTSAT